MVFRREYLLLILFKIIYDFFDSAKVNIIIATVDF
jgi:hypothetical protein